jgi:hypothetical protein
MVSVVAVCILMANVEEIAAFRVAGELPSDGRGVMLLNEDRTIAERIFRTAFRISVPTIVTLWVGVGDSVYFGPNRCARAALRGLLTR